MSEGTGAMSSKAPGISAGPVNEGFGLCMMSLCLEPGFDAEESDCGGDAGGGCTTVAGTGSGGYCSVARGSDGVWNVTGPVP